MDYVIVNQRTGHPYGANPLWSLFMFYQQIAPTERFFVVSSKPF